MKTVKLSSITRGTLLYSLASAKINIQGFYTCILKGERTTITK